MARYLYIVTFLLSCMCVWLWFNNDYMNPRDFHVTMVDKFKEERCHKHGCNLYLKGLFKTEDGILFDLDLTMASYTRLNPGGPAVFELRPFDVKQTPKQNILFFFGPVIIYTLTILCLFICTLEIYPYYKKLRPPLGESK